MKIYKRVSFLLAIYLCASLASGAEIEGHIDNGRQAIKSFAMNLKAALMQGMSNGGPVNAIHVCQIKAPQIADSISSDFNGQIARTSLKPRNSDNAPSAWERKVLNVFESRKASGEDINSLEHHEVVVNDGEPALRYMKAIPTQGVCLACHGKQLAPEVEAALAERYPMDQATGFEIGDIRGAFTVYMPLDDSHGPVESN